MVGWDVEHLRHTAFGFPAVHFHLQHVNHLVVACARINRVLNNGHFVAVERVQLLNRLFEVGFLVVELVHGNQHRSVQAVAVARNCLRSHLNTLRRVDDHNGGIGHGERRYNTAHKIVQSRGVDNVQLLVVELDVQNS